ncbi:YciI family protein [Falsiphaeobacter marinintestinus]|uniref:YciI family protein n=1 Tax=Falsiphaeobacter marinintestinus TaxID=1492905 RepID=UPI0011B72353|nr:YciI family protein [Phaeobacter marinintestinus]
MPRWDDYKQHAKERGALALELYAVESTPSESGPAVPDVLADHLAYQRDLEITGKLVLAGPMSDLSGEMMEGAGLMIYRAASFEEAQAIAKADPMHARGARTYVLRRWLVNEGSVHLSVGLSTGTVDLS